MRDLTYRLDVAEAIPAQLHTDPGRLRQVLLNYLSNATKFANPGEVVLKVETDEAEGPTQHGLRVSVLDRGPVISEEDRGKLFKPFSRLDRPEGDQAMGSGLGLSICQRLVTLMGGSVGCEPWHEDGVEIGNRFWLTLPAKTLVVPVMAAPEPEPEAPSEPSDFEIGRAHV